MTVLANVAVAVVAALHVGFLVLEMFLWTKPIGRRVFGLPLEVVVSSAKLAANQGLYNGFLAAGLVWGLVAGGAGLSIKVFFLSCVIVAGIFGAVTAKRSILWVQALPGLVALLLVVFART
jgi:putative membrane protein